MSVVCCKVTEEKIEIASDSISVRGYTQTKSQNVKYSKLVKVDEMIIGSVGYVEESVLMQVFCQTHKPLSPTTNGYLDFLSEFSRWQKEITDNGSIANSYIFVYQERAFYTHGFLVQEISGYEATGAGMDYALSAMFLGRDVKEAVGVACELSVYCEKPIVYFEIVKEQGLKNE